MLDTAAGLDRREPAGLDRAVRQARRAPARPPARASPATEGQERMTDQAPETGELTFTRVFDAPRELVFRCMIEPEHLTHFWGPAGVSAPIEHIKVDPRPGGVFETVMVNDADGSRYPTTGRVRRGDGAGAARVDRVRLRHDDDRDVRRPRRRAHRGTDPADQRARGDTAAPRRRPASRPHSTGSPPTSTSSEAHDDHTIHDRRRPPPARRRCRVRQLAGLLAGHRRGQWDTPSLCAGWRVRDVVAHMTMPARYSQEEFMAELSRCEFDFTRLSNEVASRDAGRRTSLSPVSVPTSCSAGRRLAAATTARSST